MNSSKLQISSAILFFSMLCLTLGWATPQTEAKPSTPAPAPAPNQKAVGLTVLVDQKKVDFKDAPPQVVVGRTMVPMRAIFEAIGAYVEYNDMDHTVKAQRNNEIVDLRIGSRLAHKNGAEILMDVKPQVIRGSTMVPLRFIAESLGAEVDFDKANNRINISTGG